jgi:hypothetical protein
MSEWLSTVVAGCALVVSLLNAIVANRRYHREQRTAHLTAYFSNNRSKSRVDMPDRRIHVGYNLVIWNQGPATARGVCLEVRRPTGQVVDLVSVEDGEFPLSRIDRDGRYPVQFAPKMREFFEADAHAVIRRFDVLLSWIDDNGSNEKVIPLRRGQIG